MKSRVERALAGAVVVAALAWGSEALAAGSCVEAGVITRIHGRPQDLSINRAGAPVDRVRVLEPLCVGDRIAATGATWASLSLDGSTTTTVKVDAGHPFTVPTQASNSLAQNGWNLALFNLSRDMKRRPWDVRLRGPGPELGFALASLSTTPQQLTPGRRQLLLRLDGGVGTYDVSLADASGKVLGQVQTKESDVVLPLAAPLGVGDYAVKVRDTAGTELEGKVKVVSTPPPVSAAEVGFADPEVRVALAASELARRAPTVWALEAEQMLHAAPPAAGGLDRSSIYELIEGYDDE